MSAARYEYRTFPRKYREADPVAPLTEEEIRDAHTEMQEEGVDPLSISVRTDGKVYIYRAPALITEEVSA